LPGELARPARTFLRQAGAEEFVARNLLEGSGDGSGVMRIEKQRGFASDVRHGFDGRARRRDPGRESLEYRNSEAFKERRKHESPGAPVEIVQGLARNPPGKLYGAA
jgi:hypothetical protein